MKSLPGPRTTWLRWASYIFNWRNVKAYLQADNSDKASTNDFGH